MAYVSDSNLTQFWGLAKDHINAEDGRFANWQKTEKAGAVGVWPVGGTPLLPTVDFAFTETEPASGDKGPDNPSTITGVTQATVTRCGKNLILPRADLTTTTINGVAFTVNGDGTYTVNGLASVDTYFYIRFTSNGLSLKQGCTYYLSGCPIGGSGATFSLNCSKSGVSYSDTGSGATIIPASDQFLNCSILVKSGTTVSNLVFKPQLELGSTATAFEPYDGADYTISFGGTYYGGNIDLATGFMTVTHEYKTLTAVSYCSAENSSGYVTAYSWPTHWGEEYVGRVFKAISACSELSLSGSGERVYLGGLNTGNNMMPIYVQFLATRVGVTAGQTDAQRRQACTSYLSSNPLHIIFEMTTPNTVQLTPTEILSLAQADKYTPRLNTLYTDASAVQVGYAKSPIRSEYELTQAIIATEGGE